MNQKHSTDKRPVLAKLAALLILPALFCSCGKAEPVKVTKVIQTSPRVIEKAVDVLVIREVQANGVVLIGKPNTPLNCCIYRQYGTNLPFVLEGKASVGDRFVIVYHYDIEVLDSGEVRSVLRRIGIRSTRNQEWQEKFRIPTAGDNLPETQPKTQEPNGT